MPTKSKIRRCVFPFATITFILKGQCNEFFWALVSYINQTQFGP